MLEALLVGLAQIGEPLDHTRSDPAERIARNSESVSAGDALVRISDDTDGTSKFTEAATWPGAYLVA